MSRIGLFRGELVETNDKGPLQTAKALGLAGEELDGVHVVRQHGLASHAPKGSHGIGLSLTGERTLTVLLGLEHQNKRPQELPEGNTTLYDAKGNAIRMMGPDGAFIDVADRSLKAAGKTITLEATDTILLKVGGTTVKIRAGRVDLGGDDGSPVMTQAGPSSKVFAVI